VLRTKIPAGWSKTLVSLPVLTSPVAEAWQSDGGVRRPITLKAGDVFEAEGQAVVLEEGEDK